MTDSWLSLARKNILLNKKKTNIYAKVNSGSAQQMQIVAENLAIRSRMHKGTCSIQVSELEGCYSCLAGATLGVVCKCNEGEMTANIECPSQNQMAKCTKPNTYLTPRHQQSNPHLQRFLAGRDDKLHYQKNPTLCGRRPHRN
ncbi:hypothetical protein Aduo_001033 [Ancylostoma duodenale]